MDGGRRLLGSLRAGASAGAAGVAQPASDDGLAGRPGFQLPGRGWRLRASALQVRRGIGSVAALGFLATMAVLGSQAGGQFDDSAASTAASATSLRASWVSRSAASTSPASAN